MNRISKVAVAATATAVAALGMTACDTDDRNRCDTSPVVFYSTTDHTYHYGSVTGKRVPTSKLPKSATKVPGYKPYNPPAPKVKAPKVGKPGPGYKAPSAPRLRSGKR